MRIPLLALAVVAAVLGVTPAPATAAGGTSYTWVGSSQTPSADNHSWTDARNWSPSGVPGDGDSVTITQPNGSHCTAHVDNVPTVSLVDLTLLQKPDLCGTSVNGGQLTVSGTLTWDGGSLNTPTTIAAGATGSISGTNGKQNGLVQNLDVAGSLTLSGVTGTAALLITNPSVLHVLPGGTLTSQGDNKVTFLSCCNNPARVTNDGTVAVDAGTLEVDAVAFDQNGTLTASNGGRLLSTAAPVTAGPDATYGGSGGWTIHEHSHAVLSGTQTLGPDFHLELGTQTDESGSTLQGTAVLDGTGTFDWSGATIEAALTIGHGVTLHAAGTPPNNGRRILAGTDATVSPAVPTPLTVHGRLVLDDGATIATGATARLVIASDGTLSAAPGTSFVSGSCCVSPDRVVNHGTLVVPAATATDPVVLDNVFLESDGVVSVAEGSTLEANQVVTLSGGSLAGGGTVAADVDNVAATVRPAGSGLGTLMIDGSYDQHRRAVLDIDLAGGAGDRLAVHGKASLAGRVTVQNGLLYHPHLADVRTVVSADSLAGSVRCVSTSGTWSTGTHAGHWEAKVSGKHLRLIWIAGRSQC